MDVYGMEIFLIVLGLLLVAAVFSLVAAGKPFCGSAHNGIEPDDTDTVTDDLRLVRSCHELKQLAARAREEIKHG
jgi:hypothetical protein